MARSELTQTVGLALVLGVQVDNQVTPPRYRPHTLALPDGLRAARVAGQLWAS